jgi:hypothetical protein
MAHYSQQAFERDLAPRQRRARSCIRKVHTLGPSGRYDARSSGLPLFSSSSCSRAPPIRASPRRSNGVSFLARDVSGRRRSPSTPPQLFCNGSPTVVLEAARRHVRRLGWCNRASRSPRACAAMTALALAERCRRRRIRSHRCRAGADTCWIEVASAVHS